MGCDIHLYTEKKIKKDGKETWWCCDHFTPNEYYGPDEEWDTPWSLVSIYDGRNYALFTALAGVRREPDVDIISGPRGLPDDVSAIVKYESDRWGVDGHSHSWLTARELFEYQNKHPYAIRTGMLDGENLENYKKYGIPPKSWCGWTNIEGAEQHTWKVPGSVVDGLVDDVKDRMREVFYIYDFLDKNEQEKRLYEKSNDFRIVFWFDN